MRRLGLLALLLAAPAFAEELKSAKPYDDLWRASVQALVLHGFKLEVNDKNGGIIATPLTTIPDNSAWFKCSQGVGRRSSGVANLTLRISSTSDDAHTIEVLGHAHELWVKTKVKVAFVRIGREYSDVACTSTGEIERLILDTIRSNLE